MDSADESKSVEATVQEAAAAAAACRRVLAAAGADRRAMAVNAIADALLARQDRVLAANALDLQAADSLSPALRDRLLLDAERLAAMATDLKRVAQLPDLIGDQIEARTLDNGLRLSRRRVPVGTLGVIYEARPNVTTDIAALALKTGNALVLRGGRETRHSNAALLDCVRAGLRAAQLPEAAVQALPAADRAEVDALLRQDRTIDLLIPRGGQALQDHCREHARMAVVYGGIGICHLYWAASADVEKSLAVVENAKVQRPSVCNALDTLLVHQTVAAEVLPMVVNRLAPLGVQFVADERALACLHGQPAERVRRAGPEDFDREWLALVLGLKVVDDLNQAIDHIARHGTAHSDGILSDDPDEARGFLDEVDSAAVYWNASTRFTDGSAFGLGAEVAVSTQRLHARGPMALEALTTYKWVGEGEYLVRR